VKFATYIINGVNNRLTTMLCWLEGAEPDVVCSQELKNVLTTGSTGLAS
jgi:exonuclease III